jgi:ubiquitin-protein ligase E3 A
LTEGCGKQNCSNINCASNPNFKKLNQNQAAAQAIKLAKEKAELCETSSKSAKQFKLSTSQNQSPNMNNTNTENNTNNNSKTSSSPRTSTNNNMDEDDYNDYFDDEDDDNDVVVSKSSSAINLRTGSAASARSSDLKSLDDALKDAVNYVSKMNETSNNTTSKKYPYLSENRILSLLKKCKKSSSESMEVDGMMDMENKKNLNKEQLNNYLPLIHLVQQVFQNYKYLSASFTFKIDKKSSIIATLTTPTTSKQSDEQIKMSSTMPTIPPFRIDFNSLRRSYSLLFGISNDLVQEELEKAIDLSVYALCVSIRMIIKKPEIKDDELNQILHSLLVVNELPLLEDPKYMDKCAKIFYATVSELPLNACVKIIQLWSHWQADELKIFLNRLQQYITVCVISKNLDEDNNRNSNDDEDDELSENERNCLHKHEGITGAVSFLRLIYYASILGGKLDRPELIKQEKEIEAEEMKLLESQMALEEGSMFADTTNYLNTKLDPLEEILNIHPLDCREPKIPFDQFINEVANKHIDIQHDYVEYVQYIQNLEQRNYQFSKPSKKHIFSFLANPFFLVLSRKNLGLYYDNKIKMMRERRNNIMMSLLEGSMPNPYFKMRLTRNNLLVDALSLIELQEQENPSILRKQLFIEFENEQGIDQGGVSKEFFQLAIDELLNKGYSNYNLFFLLNLIYHLN